VAKATTNPVMPAARVAVAADVLAIAAAAVAT